MLQLSKLHRYATPPPQEIVDRVEELHVIEQGSKEDEVGSVELSVCVMREGCGTRGGSVGVLVERVQSALTHVLCEARVSQAPRTGQRRCSTANLPTLRLPIIFSSAACVRQLARKCSVARYKDVQYSVYTQSYQSKAPSRISIICLSLSAPWRACNEWAERPGVLEHSQFDDSATGGLYFSIYIA